MCSSDYLGYTVIRIPDINELSYRARHWVRIAHNQLFSHTPIVSETGCWYIDVWNKHDVKETVTITAFSTRNDDVTTWRIPQELIDELHDGSITDHDLIELATDEFWRFCEEESYKPIVSAHLEVEMECTYNAVYERWTNA